jgi:hypothetical protein
MNNPDVMEIMIRINNGKVVSIIKNTSRLVFIDVFDENKLRNEYNFSQEKIDKMWEENKKTYPFTIH